MIYIYVCIYILVDLCMYTCGGLWEKPRTSGAVCADVGSSSHGAAAGTQFTCFPRTNAQIVPQLERWPWQMGSWEQSCQCPYVLVCETLSD
jgi:hypothetical protein